MKILIAPDKFKQSLTAEQAALAIKGGILRSNSKVEIDVFPMGDGGEGSIDILNNYLKLEKVKVKTLDALRRPMTGFYYKNKKSAFIELATASGLQNIDTVDRDILEANTEGTGILIHHAIENGAKSIYLFVGGSATNDAGMGILSALGILFYDKLGEPLSPSGKNISLVYDIDRSVLFSKLLNIDFTVLTDVKNPFFGSNGAAHVYAEQKGASASDIERLELGLMNFAANISLKCKVDIENVEGSGAAGGVAGGLFGILNANIEQGFDFISRMIDLESKIKETDWVISGEGKLDIQSLNGKVIFGISKLSNNYHKRLVLMVGQNVLHDSNTFDCSQIYSVLDLAIDKKDAIQNATQYLDELGFEFAEQYL